MTLEELMFRRMICRACLRAVSEVDVVDVRRGPALVEYNRQLAEIDAQITALTGTPPETVIGLKSAVLVPQVPSLKG